jgi:hypothetical protein
MLHHLDSYHQLSSPKIAAVHKRSSSILDLNASPRSKSEKKSMFARSTALWIARDLLPFNVVNGPGFQDWMLTNKFVTSLEEIPSNSTISNSALNDVYLMVQDAFKRRILNAPKTIVIITDLWTAKCGAIPYITICMKYLDKDFKLQNFTITTEHLPRPHESVVIAKCIEENLQENNLGDRNVIGVGDMGANVRGVKNFMTKMKVYIDCEAHKIHKNLTSDVIKDPRWEKAKDILGVLKRIHGALCYQLVKLREIYMQQQAEDFLNYLSTLENLRQELVDDENVPYFPNDEESSQSLQEAFANFSQGLSRPTSFEKPNVTRWFSMMRMVESFLKNMGKHFE